MKRKTAKEILADSFRELAKEKPIDRITVREIAVNCGYSSATFYRHFKDKYDLIVWDYTKQTALIMNKVGTSDYDWRNTLLEGLNHFQREKEYLVNILKHTSGHDSFIQYMTNIHCEELSSLIRRITGIKQLDSKTEMYIRLYCMGTTCLNCEWILGKFDATPEEMAELYENSLPAPLQPLLLKMQ